MNNIDFTIVHAGEWVQPSRKGYLMKCCDCGLIHKLQFRLITYGNGKKHKIQMRAYRYEEKTEE
jgi:hypothetical protein